MTALADIATADSCTVERIVKVVAIDRDWAWAEPEPTTGCSACTAAATCGSGKTGRRMVLPRTPDQDQASLQVGEWLILGIDQAILMRAAMIGYGVPLVTMLTGGVIAWALGGSDGWAAAGTLAGLLIGILIGRVAAARLSRRGELAPRILRRSMRSLAIQLPNT